MIVRSNEEGALLFSANSWPLVSLITFTVKWGRSTVVLVKFLATRSLNLVSFNVWCCLVVEMMVRLYNKTIVKPRV